MLLCSRSPRPCPRLPVPIPSGSPRPVLLLLLPAASSAAQSISSQLSSFYSSPSPPQARAVVRRPESASPWAPCRESQGRRAIFYCLILTKKHKKGGRD
jgi:hypothetical protein